MCCLTFDKTLSFVCHPNRFLLFCFMFVCDLYSSLHVSHLLFSGSRHGNDSQFNVVFTQNSSP